MVVMCGRAVPCCGSPNRAAFIPADPRRSHGILGPLQRLLVPGQTSLQHISSVPDLGIDDQGRVIHYSSPPSPGRNSIDVAGTAATSNRTHHHTAINTSRSTSTSSVFDPPQPQRARKDAALPDVQMTTPPPRQRPSQHAPSNEPPPKLYQGRDAPADASATVAAAGKQGTGNRSTGNSSFTSIDSQEAAAVATGGDAAADAVQVNVAAPAAPAPAAPPAPSGPISWAQSLFGFRLVS